MFKKIGKIAKIPKEFLNSLKELKSGYKETAKPKKAKALMVYDGKAQFIDANLSKDLGWVTPKNYNLRFRNQHSLILEPENYPLYIINIENPETLDLEKPPEIDTVDREKITEYDDKGKVTKIYDMEEFDIKGGRIMAEMSYLVGSTGLLKYIEPPSKREMLYIAIVSGLFSFILGMFFYAWWFS